MPAQHHAQDVMRAIESDRWAVRATNTGYSELLIPTAEPSGYLDLTPTNCTRQRSTGNRRRLYTYVGDWLTPLLVLGTIAWWINAGINKHR